MEIPQITTNGIKNSHPLPNQVTKSFAKLERGWKATILGLLLLVVRVLVVPLV
jgi:hypothetical protein